jgi:hypothetical protein
LSIFPFCEHLTEQGSDQSDKEIVAEQSEHQNVHDRARAAYHEKRPYGVGDKVSHDKHYAEHFGGGDKVFPEGLHHRPYRQTLHFKREYEHYDEYHHFADRRGDRRAYRSAYGYHERV